MPHIISKACTKCGACLVECPTGSIVEGSEQFFIDTDTCSDHASCVAVCPVDAITLRPVATAPSGGSSLGKPLDEEEEEEA